MAATFPTLREQLGLPELADKRTENQNMELEEPPSPLDQAINDLKAIELQSPDAKEIGGDNWELHQQFYREIHDQVRRCYREDQRLNYEKDKQCVIGMRDIQIQQVMTKGVKCSEQFRVRLGMKMNRVLRYETENGIARAEGSRRCQR